MLISCVCFDFHFHLLQDEVLLLKLSDAVIYGCSIVPLGAILLVQYIIPTCLTIQLHVLYLSNN